MLKNLSCSRTGDLGGPKAEHTPSCKRCRPREFQKPRRPLRPCSRDLAGTKGKETFTRMRARPWSPKSGQAPLHVGASVCLKMGFLTVTSRMRCFDICCCIFTLCIRLLDRSGGTSQEHSGSDSHVPGGPLALTWPNFSQPDNISNRDAAQHSGFPSRPASATAEPNHRNVTGQSEPLLTVAPLRYIQPYKIVSTWTRPTSAQCELLHVGTGIHQLIT